MNDENARAGQDPLEPAQPEQQSSDFQEADANVPPPTVDEPEQVTPPLATDEPEDGWTAYTTTAPITLRFGPNASDPDERELPAGRTVRGAGDAIGGSTYRVGDEPSDRWVELHVVSGQKLARPLYAPALALARKG